MTAPPTRMIRSNGRPLIASQRPRHQKASRNPFRNRAELPLNQNRHRALPAIHTNRTGSSTEIEMVPNVGNSRVTSLPGTMSWANAVENTIALRFND